MSNSQYILRLFNGEVETTEERLRFFQKIDENFSLYNIEKQDWYTLNDYYMKCEEEFNCLAFIHFSKFNDFYTKIDQWSPNYRKYLYLVIFSGDLIGDELKQKIIEEAKKSDYEKNIFILQKRYDQLKDSNINDKLKQFVNTFISFSVNEEVTIENLHDIFNRINYEPRIEYLYALYFMCQGYLTVSAFHNIEKSESPNSEETNNIIDKLHINTPIQNEFIRNLKVKYKDVIKREFWTDVFDDADEFEKQIKNEWGELTSNDKIPESFYQFSQFIRSEKTDPTLPLIIQVFEDIINKLDSAI